MVLTLALVVAAAFWIPRALATDAKTEATALRFIEERGIGNNMKPLAKVAVLRTTTFAAMAMRVGQDKAMAYLAPELEAAQPKYQPQWNRNLAAAYATYLSAEEIDSLRVHGRASLAAAKLNSLQGKISEDMQNRSRQVLIDYLGEALKNAFSRFSAENPVKK